jgi:hypothetical protein
VSFLGKLFGRRETPKPTDKRDWNDDWRVGDTAECIVDGVRASWHEAVKPWERPAFRQQLRVIGFKEGLGVDHSLRYFLVFADWPIALPTSAFRKVRPQAKAQSEIVERILSAQPGVDVTREPAREPANAA